MMNPKIGLLNINNPVLFGLPKPLGMDVTMKTCYINVDQVSEVGMEIPTHWVTKKSANNNGEAMNKYAV